MLARRYALTLTALLIAACSGSGSGDSDGTGGAGGSGGGTNGKQCPDGPPADGDRCGTIGAQCQYPGSPCGVNATCVGGRWQAETTCPPAQQCPVSQPSAGDPCTLDNPVTGSLTCLYDTCPSGTLSGPRFQATCDGTAWQVTELDCRPAFECGACPPGLVCDGTCEPGETCGRNQCEVGTLCVRVNYASGDWAWDCAANQCAPAATDCSCVGNACNQRGFPGDWQCTASVGDTITCDCMGPDC